MTDSKQFIQITEVGPRDGLQNENQKLSVEQRVEFVRGLVQAGAKDIEVGAFVSPKWVPQMAESFEVLQKLSDLNHKITLSALVPNEKGIDLAIAAGVKKIAVFTAASESFNQKNINCSIAESFKRFETVFQKAKAHNIQVRGYISTAFVCPFEGEISADQTLQVIKSFLDYGITDLSIGDTIGKATPHHVAKLMQTLKKQHFQQNLDLAMHFHDTYNLALVNVHESLKWGVTHFDSSAGGLGGCPYAPKASGNLASEDLVFYLTSQGYTCDYKIKPLIKASQNIFKNLKKTSPSKVHLALT